MPSEIEVPIEKVQEDLHHQIHEHGDQRWFGFSAMISAVFAVFAALAALQAGHHANEAMMEQIQSSDRWSHYQAKSIKASILESRRELVSVLGKPVSEKVEDKLREYKREQEEISAEAKEKQEKAKEHLRHHETLATAVTLFQIAIAVTAIAVLTRRRTFLYVSCLFGLIGIFFLAKGLVA